MRRSALLMGLVALCVGLTGSSAFAVDYIVNPGFEDNTPLPAGWPDYGDGNAAPWTYWGGTGGAVANPLVNADNPSARVWSNFGNPTYVNVASQNFMDHIWLTPGATYRVQAQYLVPSTEVLPGIVPRAGIYLSMYDGALYRILDPRYPESTSNPADPTISVLDSWYSYDFLWTMPGTLGDPTQRLNYMSFRLFGGNGETLGSNPGGYFDNLHFSEVPEPSSIVSLLALTGGGVLTALRRRIK